MNRHPCSGCGLWFCDGQCYDADPPQAELSPELLAHRDALREKLERELRFLIELEKQRRAA
jgi:hypothetical protein